VTAGARFHDRPRRGWRVVRVTGASMRPTLRPGDLLLIRRGAVPVAGDVVVADLPGGRGEGVKRAVRREAGGWWLERDNRAVGTDSWLFGEVADADVRGVVRLRLWPRPGRVGDVSSSGRVDRRNP
jgi:hypothetical protein